MYNRSLASYSSSLSPQHSCRVVSWQCMWIHVYAYWISSIFLKNTKIEKTNRCALTSHAHHMLFALVCMQSLGRLQILRNRVYLFTKNRSSLIFPANKGNDENRWASISRPSPITCYLRAKFQIHAVVEPEKSHWQKVTHLTQPASHPISPIWRCAEENDPIIV